MNNKITEITPITAQQMLACLWLKALASQTYCTMTEALEHFESYISYANQLGTQVNPGDAEFFEKIQTLYGSTKDILPQLFDYMLQHAPRMTTSQLYTVQWLFDEAEETDSSVIQAEYMLAQRVSASEPASYPIKQLWVRLASQEKKLALDVTDILLKQNQLVNELEGGWYTC